MAIDLNSGKGLFDRIGKMGHVLNITNTFVGDLAAGNLPQEVNDVLALYDAEPNSERATANGLLPALADQQNAMQAIRSGLRTAAEAVLIQMADEDNPLSSRTKDAALDELIKQMVANPDTVSAPVISATVTPAAANSGDGVMIVSMFDATGLALENAFPETMVFTVTDNSSPGSERFAGRSPATVTDKLSHRWPGGSALVQDYFVRDPGTATFVFNGTFETFTGDAPDGWIIETGTAGTTVFEELTEVYRGVSALKIDGNGVELTKLSQVLTLANAAQRQNYPVQLRIKVDAVPAAGLLNIDLWDGTAIINDQNGNPNSLSVDLTGVGTAYEVRVSSFRLPSPLPASVSVRLHLTTALTATSNVFIDDLAIGNAVMDPTYAAGPSVAIFAGATPFALDDLISSLIANDRSGEFQDLFNRLFDLPTKLLPSTSGAPSIPDSLIG